MVREGLATIVAGFPDTEVVGLAVDGAEAVALASECAPDVVLMDLRMPRIDGVDATREIRALHPAIPVVVLIHLCRRRLRVGRSFRRGGGYLTKDAARDHIRRALEAAVAGQSILAPAVQAALLKAAQHAPTTRPPSLPDGLTDREAEVLTLIAVGLSNTEIADRLYVAEATVKTHVNRIFAKTGSRGRAQAAVYAHRHGLADVDGGDPEPR